MACWPTQLSPNRSIFLYLPNLYFLTVSREACRLRNASCVNEFPAVPQSPYCLELCPRIPVNFCSCIEEEIEQAGLEVSSKPARLVIWKWCVRISFWTIANIYFNFLSPSIKIPYCSSTGTWLPPSRSFPVYHLSYHWTLYFMLWRLGCLASFCCILASCYIR
jgi:hypothetical protein